MQEELRGARVWQRLDDSIYLAYDLKALAYAYAYTGNDRYAEQVVCFADSYYDRIRPTSFADFSDAMWSSDSIRRQFINAVDIVWNWPGCDAEQRTSIINHFMAPRGPADVNESTSNYGGRAAYELYRTSMLLGRADLVDRALNGTVGRYIHDLFDADGIWIEKTFAYQNFVFNYFMELTDMAKADGGLLRDGQAGGLWARCGVSAAAE